MSKTWKDYAGPNLGTNHKTWSTPFVPVAYIESDAGKAVCCQQELAAREAWAVAQNEIEANFPQLSAEQMQDEVGKAVDAADALLQPLIDEEAGKVLASMDYSNEVSKVAYLQSLEVAAEEAIKNGTGYVAVNTGRDGNVRYEAATASSVLDAAARLVDRSPRRLIDGNGAHRKQFPLATGLLDYFPDALAEVAYLSKQGNEKHNPGQPLHHARSKSTDHADCILRHLAGRGGFDGDMRESAALAWRALALLQEELEQEQGLSLPRAATEV